MSSELENGLSRRDFLKRTTAAAAVASIAAPHARADNHKADGKKLRIAVVGLGNRGRAHVEGYAHETLAAFCDVDTRKESSLPYTWYRTADAVLQQYPDVPLFADYRVMLKEMGDQIDAVSIVTPDHMHFPIAKACIEAGKHVLVEKPLTHTVWEARELLRLADKHGVVTQMGNQGHANDGTRMCKEWIQAGIIGDVREVYHWTDRPIWEQGVRTVDHSKMVPVVPKKLDWNLWLGVAKDTAYDPAYLPFEWRGWWEYGCGALGDMACHVMDSAYYALDLGYPETIQASATSFNDESAPISSHVTYEFPSRGKMPPVTVHWYDGDLKPPLPVGVPADFQFSRSGTFLVGEGMTMYTDDYAESIRIYPTEKFREIRKNLPPKTIPRVPGSNHFQEFITACKGGPLCGSRFEYSSPFTETVLLGNVAIRAKKKLIYDAKKGEFVGNDYANSLLTKTYRDF